jgi:SNF2 family DNA or RNA helicase
MHKENLSAILADESMLHPGGLFGFFSSSIAYSDSWIAVGLGKTVQTIALLALLQLKELPGPYLIIVPSTSEWFLLPLLPSRARLVCKL